MLVTVLVAVVVASIAMVGVRAVIVSSGEGASRTQLATATALARAALVRTLAQLDRDPLAPYTRVLDDEGARLCPAEDTTVTPGNPWPATCGAEWEYASAGNRTSHVRIELPTPSSTTLVVTAIGKVGRVTTGFRQELRAGGAVRPVVFSGGRADLDTLATGTGDAALPGLVYAAGLMDWRKADTTRSLLVAESGFVTEPSGTSPATVKDRTFATAAGTGTGTPAVASARNYLPTPLTAAQLRASLTDLSRIACPLGAPKNVTSVRSSGVQRSSSLCLWAGREVRNTNGSIVTVPATTAWLVVPNASGTGASATVDVYYAPVEQYAAGAASCGNCDLAALVADQLDPEREDGPLPPHPGFESSWSLLGSFYLPSGGVIATDVDTSVGFCGAGFTGAGCRGWGDQTLGARVTDPFTLVAGTVDRPADVLLTGPLSASAAGRATLAATGRVLVPYWSRPAGAGLSITADLVALSASATVTTLPTSASASSTGGALTVSGTLMGTALKLSVDETIFSSYRFTVPIGAVIGLSPMSPAPDLNWSVITQRRLTAADLADL